MDVPDKRRGRRRGKSHAGRARLHDQQKKLVEARSAVTPVFHYPEELPVSAAREEIARALSTHQVIVVAGETGSGKTTQLPKLCMELGYGITGMIGHTQPRRIAARSVATRIAEETGLELGDGVGFQVRFTANVANSTRVKVMTDGILLAELQHDKLLSAYDVIIIDEAHERSLNIDFLVGFLAKLLPKRPDLKVIITSATIDPESFAQHFSRTPIVQVSGRTYPVDIRYRPLEGAGEDDDADGPGTDGTYDTGSADQIDGIIAAVDELAREEPGDILVFLSGEREIRDTEDALNSHLSTSLITRYRTWEVVPLFGRLSAAEQQRIFTPHTGTRVVLATNVAETSLTVPGIKYVIDAGTARISRYSNRTKVQRLPIERISQASARQRAGRAGRLSPGICIRLYSEADFTHRPEFTEPEILRTHLASVVLQMLVLGLVQTEGDIASFPFLTPPEPKAVRDGAALLTDLGAIRVENGRLRLTRLGRTLGSLPIDPRMARMVMAGVEAGVGAEVVVIVAALSLQDPRERPLDVRQKADEFHARFVRPNSDFMSYVALWNYIHEQAAALSRSKLRALLKDEFINFVRVREWQDLVAQLCSMLASVGHPIPTPGAGLAQGDGAGGATGGADAAIHTALLTGLVSSVGAKTPDGKDYLGARGARFRIFPGSALAKVKPDLVVAAELVETSRLWARTVASVDPAWVIAAAGPLIRHQYSEPHWSIKKGQAFAYDRVSIYGITLTNDTRVGYARINPSEARDMFIRHALIDGEWNEQHSFVRHNEKALAKAHELADRVRDNRLRADDELLFEFYDQALPAKVHSAPSFNAWWKKARQDNPAALNIDPDTLVAGDTVHARESAVHAFPLDWTLIGLPAGIKTSAKLRYSYDPGTDHDGVTLHLSEAQAAAVNPDQFTWQVPGLRLELITALIRSLPKAKRRYFVPAPDVATHLLSTLNPYEGTLVEELADALTKRAGGGELTDLPPIIVETCDFDLTRIPAHLIMTFVVHHPDGSSSKGTDVRDLISPRALPVPAAPSPVVVPPSSSGAVPVLRPRPGEVDGEVRTTSAKDVRENARAIAAGCGEARAYVVSGLSQRAKLTLAVARGDIVADAVFSTVFGVIEGMDGSQAELTRAVNDVIVERLEATLGHVVLALELAGQVEKLVSKSSSLTILAGLTDVKEHVASLMYPGWVGNTHPRFIPRYPAYLEAVKIRTEKMGTQVARDRQFMDRVRRVTDSVREVGWAMIRGYDLGEGDIDQRAVTLPRELQDLLFDVEELRISLWAPGVGAAHPVSEERIVKAVKKARR